MLHPREHSPLPGITAEPVTYLLPRLHGREGSEGLGCQGHTAKGKYLNACGKTYYIPPDLASFGWASTFQLQALLPLQPQGLFRRWEARGERDLENGTLPQLWEHCSILTRL